MTKQSTGDSPAVRGWLPEEEAFARNLWAEGKSASVIAKALLDTFGIVKTSNAVIGRKHRCGWTRNGETRRETLIKPAKPKPERKVVPLLPVKAPHPPPPPPPVALEPLRLVELPGYGQCKWEVSGGTFCGLPTERTSRGHRASYCPQCAKRVYVPLSKKAVRAC